MKNKTITKYTGYVFVLIGLIFLFFQLKEFYKTQKIVSENNLVNCKIVSERFSSYSNEDIYIYTIEYIINGKKYYIETKNNSSNKKYYIGQELSIYYSSTNPKNAILNTWDELYGKHVIGFFLSFVFFIIGLICSIFSEKLSKIFKADIFIF